MSVFKMIGPISSNDADDHFNKRNSKDYKKKKKHE